jgi:hypothetical protein
MRSITASIFLIILFSCHTKTDSHSNSSLPEKPGSVETVQTSLKGKNFKTINADTLSPFEMDKDSPYEWQDKITDSFTKKNLAEQLSFSLHFLNDTAVTIFNDGQEKQGTYIADTTTNGDEQPGVKLRISHMEFGNGSNDMMKVTYTYPVNGISDKQLLLLTPRNINRRKVVVLMEAK